MQLELTINSASVKLLQISIYSLLFRRNFLAFAPLISLQFFISRFWLCLPALSKLLLQQPIGIYSFHASFLTPPPPPLFSHFHHPCHLCSHCFRPQVSNWSKLLPLAISQPFIHFHSIFMPICGILCHLSNQKDTKS